MTVADQQELFQRYLAVCNEALSANKDRFPFKQILGTTRPEDFSRNIEVCIIDDQPEAAFVVSVETDGIKAKDHKSCANCQCDGKWRVKKSYLQTVIANPQAYINNPAMIDWEWLYKARS